MRSVMLSALVAAGLAITMASPRTAQAQIVFYPTVTASPYATGNYWAPSYNYAYSWATPYYSNYSYGWSNPYSTWNWTWSNATPYYYSPYRTGLGWPTYRARYWGWY
jgi:hypothetical protein